MVSPTQWTWVWVSSRSWWWTGRPGELQPMGSQRVRHDYYSVHTPHIKHHSFISGHSGCFHVSDMVNRAAVNMEMQVFLWVISFPSDEFSHQLVTVVTSYSQLQRVSPTLCNLMDCSTPGFPAHHQIPELTQTHVHWVSDAIQPSHPLSSPSPPAFNLSQDHGLLQWVSSSHQVSKVLQL